MVGTGDRKDSERRARFEALYAAHMHELVRFVGHRLPVESAGDVVAEVFVVCWRRLDEVDPDNPRAWLFGVAHRLVANERRSRWRRRRLEARAEQLGVAEEAPGPEDWVGAAEDRRLVLAALDRLSPTDRDLLVAVTWDGLAVADAARVYGCTPATLSVRLHRARARLGEEFRKVDARRATSATEKEAR